METHLATQGILSHRSFPAAGSTYIFLSLSPCLVHQLYLVLLTEGLYPWCTPEKEPS